MSETFRYPGPKVSKYEGSSDRVDFRDHSRPGGPEGLGPLSVASCFGGVTVPLPELVVALSPDDGVLPVPLHTDREPPDDPVEDHEGVGQGRHSPVHVCGVG